jgi:serine/threonine-protein kinase RsbW
LALARGRRALPAVLTASHDPMILCTGAGFSRDPGVAAPPPRGVRVGRFQLNSRLDQVQHADAWLRAEILPFASEPVRHDLALVLEEVLTNVIRHGYGAEAAGPIELSAEISDGRLRLEVRDQARAFDPFSAAPPDLEAGVEDRPVGGLGIFLVRRLMDRVEYRREEHENVLVMEKHLS